MIYEVEKIYYYFRKAQSEFNNRGFRMPKDFQNFLKNTLSKVNRQKLIKLTNRFNTRWNNIDPYKYFQCGFSLYKKNFSYIKFLEEKILKLYITRDKIEKRKIIAEKEKLIETAKFIKKYLNKNEIKLRDYIHKYDKDNKRIILDHYVKGKIDNFFFIWLMKYKGLSLTDTEKAYIPYLSENYRKISMELKNVLSFLKKLESKLL